MSKHSVAEVQAKLPELIDQIRGGEPVTIVSNGEDVARIDAVPRQVRTPVPTDVAWLAANLVARTAPKDDAATLIRKIRDEVPE
jgi:antitoxin (DNA-binding transcriptional repressor) of toxin-antitoxin stability system